MSPQASVFALVEEPFQGPVALRRQLLHPIVFGRQIRVDSQLVADQNNRACQAQTKYRCDADDDAHILAPRFPVT
jgi:hypothetical protein